MADDYLNEKMKDINISCGKKKRFLLQIMRMNMMLVTIVMMIIVVVAMKSKLEDVLKK